MKSHQNKIIGEGLTYDDVLLVPNFSKILPREVSIQTKFSKNISINIPIISTEEEKKKVIDRLKEFKASFLLSLAFIYCNS